MRIALGILSYVYLSLAAAQAPSAPANPQDAHTAAERAPLADPADLEPAADVGNIMRPGRLTPAETPAATQAPTATQAPDTPQASNRATSSGVMDKLDLGTTSITGNQELPKVLYIVPWKKADLGDLVGRPVNTLLDEVLEPVDPDVFERHLEYYESLYGSSNKE